MESVVNRIKDLMSSKNMTASEFADSIGVKKANVSHVLSGRNKPSLEFVLRICEAYEEVDANSLLFPEINKGDSQISETKKLNTDKNSAMIDSENQSLNLDDNKEIERIVIFFKDKTFKEYRNDSST